MVVASMTTLLYHKNDNNDNDIVIEFVDRIKPGKIFETKLADDNDSPMKQLFAVLQYIHHYMLYAMKPRAWAIKYPPFFRCIIMFLHFILLLFIYDNAMMTRNYNDDNDDNGINDSIRVLIVLL